MSTTKKIQRIISENDIQKCWCVKEQLYKPCIEFNTSSNTHGYQYHCKECAYKLEQGIIEPLIPEYVREGADILLKGMGYNLESEIPIYEQFLKKHSINDTI